MRTLLAAAAAVVVSVVAACGAETTTAVDPPRTPATGSIPDQFPLLDGYPTDAQAEGDRYGRAGPSRDLDPLVPEACGRQVGTPEHADLLRADWTNVEDYRHRQLVLLSDEGVAEQYAERLIDLYRNCPKEVTSAKLQEGRISVVVDGRLGDWSAVAVTRSTLGGLPTTGMQTTQVVRVGRAVLLATESGEGGAARDAVRRGVTASTAAISGVVDAMKRLD